MAHFIEHGHQLSGLHLGLAFAHVLRESGIQGLTLSQQGLAQCFDARDPLRCAAAAQDQRMGALCFKGCAQLISGRVEDLIGRQGGSVRSEFGGHGGQLSIHARSNY